MKTTPTNSRFDESETDQLILNFGTKMSPENYNEMKEFLSGQREEFLTKERSRSNKRENSGRGI